MVTGLAIAGSLAGWLILVWIATAGPRLGRVSSDPGVVPVPPVSPPAGTPVEELTPYELRAGAHLSRRAGPLLEIPAAALADGFEGGAGPFRQAFRGDVVAAARRLGLTRPTLSTPRKAVLCLFALVPAGVALGAAYAGAGGWSPSAIPARGSGPGLSVGALGAFCLLTTPGIPLLAFLGYEVAGGSRGIELGIVTGVALDALVVVRGVSRWAHLPRLAKFDGMVLRQWEVDSSDDGTSYYVAVDDGVSPQARAFEVRAADYRRLPPGTLAHVRINARLNKLIDVEATRPPATSPRIADPAPQVGPP